MPASHSPTPYAMRSQPQQQNIPSTISAGPSQPAKSSASTPHVEYLSDSSAGWIVQWFNDEKRMRWKLGVPQFKYCKKRKDHFSDEFSEIWYKAPYKYHMSLDVKNMSESQNVMACIDLNYEDGQKVVLYNNTGTQPSSSKRTKDKNSVISNNENSFVVSTSTGEDTTSPTSAISTVTIGPFSFNICSYKQDGRKFRMVIYLYEPNGTSVGVEANGSASLCCCLISPAFTIRAKKPIAKPGSKKKDTKRKKTSDDEDLEEETPTKKSKMEIPSEQTPSKPIMVQPTIAIPTASTSSSSQNEANNSNPNELTGDALDALLATFGEEDFEKMSEKQLDKPNAEKVANMVSTFQRMNDDDRKQLLCRLIESCLPFEKEFIYEKYFGSNSLDNFSYRQSTPTTQSSSQVNSQYPNNYYGNVLSNQQYHVIQQQQQDIYDYFAMLAQDAQRSHQMLPQQQHHQQIPQIQNQMRPTNTPSSSGTSGSAGTGTGNEVDSFFTQLFD